MANQEDQGEPSEHCVVDGEVIMEVIDCDNFSPSKLAMDTLGGNNVEKRELSDIDNVSKPLFIPEVSATSNSSATSAAEPAAAAGRNAKKEVEQEEQPSSYYAIVTGCPWPECLTNALLCVIPKTGLCCLKPDDDAAVNSTQQPPNNGEPPIMARRQGLQIQDDSILDLQHILSSPTGSRVSAQQPSAPKRGLMAIHSAWANCTNALRYRMAHAVVALSCRAANYPYITLVTVFALSFALLIVGVFTNFELNLDTQMTFTPSNSPLLEYWQWEHMSHQERMEQSKGTYGRRMLENQGGQRMLQEVLDDLEAPAANATGQNQDGRLLTLIIHADDDNVFHIDGVEHLFQVLDAMRGLPSWERECQKSGYIDQYGHTTCEIWGVSRFFNNNKALFEKKVITDEDLFDAADATFFPDGGFVDIPSILGKHTEDEAGRPVSGKAFFVWAFLSGSNQMDREVVAKLLKLNDEWKANDNIPYTIEILAAHSYSDEILRALLNDVPLIPVVFAIMIAFTCLFFFRWNRVESRCVLGFGSIVTIFMSIMSGYGVMFIAGIPMTSMTNLLIFIVIGIGLDDTFIIVGAYFRTADVDDIIERIEATMESCGLSITLTTITTSVAFALGCMSSIPAIRWLCLYCAATIIIDFIYQITFFVAILVIDDRRVQQNRRDCCCCFVVPSANAKNTEDDGNEVRTRLGSTDGPVMDDAGGNPYGYETHEPTRIQHEHQSDHFADQFMRWYANKLMLPWVKVVVLFLFAGLTAGLTYSATKMKQQFNYKELLPKDSYVTNFVTVSEGFSSRQVGPVIKFRNVDQSDPEIQRQMLDYIDQIKALDAFGEDPPICWIQQYHDFITNNDTLSGFTFYQQLDILMADPRVRDMYLKSILRDPQGLIVESSCTIFVNEIDWDSVNSQTEILLAQRAVSTAQPVNQGRDTFAFYTFDTFYFIWEFYNVAVKELVSTTISSVISVCLLSFILVPHWSAVPIIFPIISVLFVDLIGTLQLFGYYINVVTYVTLVVSIGLLVDFNLHILLRYYESVHLTREEKVKDALGTMGASILVGGLSTFLGVVPLIFSTSTILSTVCLAMLSLVTLGLTHGLILLPVLLSYFGTEVCIQHRRRLTLLPITTSPSVEEVIQRHLVSPVSSLGAAADTRRLSNLSSPPDKTTEAVAE